MSTPALPIELHARHLAYAADAISALAVIGTILQYAPPVAAIGALIWYCVQIWESRTVQGWWRQRRQRQRSMKALYRKGYPDKHPSHPRRHQ